MLNMKDYAAPESLQEAWSLYSTSPNNVILGGCGYLRLGNKRIGTGIDLSRLGLDSVKVHDAYIEIGAMTRLRELETNEVLKKHFGDILERSVQSIVGVSFRNTATLGGSVFGRYGFSDVITALLALDASVELYKGGVVDLESFLEAPPAYDILVSVRIPIGEVKGFYEGFRHSAGDYPILTVAVVRRGSELNIAVGARPMRAARPVKAIEMLMSSGSGVTPDENLKAKAAKLASEELVFGSNMRGQKEYRQHLCKVLVQRGLDAVTECEVSQ